MAITFDGLKNIATKKSGKKKAVMNFHLVVNNSGLEGAATPQAIPGWATTDAGSTLPLFNGWNFTFDPTTYQGSYTFGDGKALLLSFQRVWSYTIDATHGLCAGRVVILVRSSGELFIFGPKNINQIVNSAVPAQVETETALIPISASFPGMIDIFVEPDQITGGTQVLPASFILRATLYNYDVQTESAI